jgi:hypothetical protein
MSYIRHSSECRQFLSMPLVRWWDASEEEEKAGEGEREMCVRIVRTEERCASGLYRRQGGKRTPRRSERRPRRAEPLVRLRRAPGCIGSSAHWADRGAYSGCSVSWTGSEACSARCMHWADCRDGQRPMHALGRLSRRTSIKTGRGSVGNRRLGTEGTRRRDGTRRVRLVRKERRGVSSQYGRGGRGGRGMAHGRRGGTDRVDQALPRKGKAPPVLAHPAQLGKDLDP